MKEIRSILQKKNLKIFLINFICWLVIVGGLNTLYRIEIDGRDLTPGSVALTFLFALVYAIGMTFFINTKFYKGSR